MKPITFFFLASTLLACGNHGSEMPAPKASSARARVSVEDLMQSPADFLNQPVAVRGVVSLHGNTADVFMLISDEEFKKCGLTNCAEFELPVRMSGVAPAIGDRVIVEGAIHAENGKFAFIATGMRLRP
ncbi:MAG: hypothetical protein ONB44_08595 [candidate division KSB1 bacterium]|nr:hypothetical protein [candidate division KSB1 bacterium]MDZ7302188.1 hypothetical protein [candidate division KSB1 bacterium]MDZ7311297.1 hypothetical protein [candidate division KSB1 bacterium]